MKRYFLNQRNLQWIALSSMAVFVLLEASILVPELLNSLRQDYWYQNPGRHLLLFLHREYWGEAFSNNLAIHVARICSNIALAISISTSLIAGGFLIYSRQQLLRALALFIAGTLLFSYCLFWPMASYLLRSRQIQEFRESNKESLAELRENLDSGKLAPEILDKAWKYYAKSFYVDTGTSIEFPLSSGVKETYKPTDSDRKLRQYFLDSYSRWQNPPYKPVVLWSLLFFISVLLGVSLPRFFQSNEQVHSATDT